MAEAKKSGKDSQTPQLELVGSALVVVRNVE